MELAEATVVITGAGSGLGQAMALAFAEAGATVWVTDADGDRAARVAGEIRGAGGRAEDALLDVRRDGDWAELDERVAAVGTEVDVLVNNAGVAAAGNLEQTPLADWEWVMAIDLMGVVRGCHRFLPGLRRRARGHVVNVASFAGLAGLPGIAAYGTAKAGVVALSEQLRAELHGSGVGVSVVCPAFVTTRLTESMRAPDRSYHQRVERWMERSGVSAENVAEAVVEAVRSERFWVLTHPETRWAWRIKRWFPGWYFRTVVRKGSMTKRERAA